MKPRRFHLSDFPENIYVDLNKGFKKNLFKEAISKVGNKAALARYLKEGRMRINFWMNGYRIMYKKRHSEYIPLRVIKNLSKLLNLPLIRIEKEIYAYKSRGSRYSIIKPKFPIIESGALMRITAHFIGDGCGLKDPYYCNKQKNLCMQFKKDLNLFGKVYTRLSYLKDRKQYHMHTLKVVPNLIRYFYKIDLETFTSRIPNDFYSLPRNLIAEFLKAFIDDEGNVDADSIRIYSANGILLEGLSDLIKLKFPDLSIKFGKNGENIRDYLIRIPKKDIIKFNKFVGNVYHPIKKEKIEHLIKLTQWQNSRGKKRPYNRDTKKQIINIITNKPSTSYDIAKSLYLSERYLRTHLKELFNKNQIYVVNKTETNAVVWGRKNGT